MAVAGMSDKLGKLHELLKSSAGTQAAEEAQNVLVDLGHILLRPLVDTELAFATSELFHKENGLLSLLRKMAPKEEFAGCKEQALKLIGAFAAKRGKHILQHAVEVKETCSSLYLMDKSTKVKSASLGVLTQILQLAAQHQSNVDLEVSALVKKYFW